MRRTLERIDISENVARRKRFEFATLAGMVCGLIGFGAFAGAAFVQGGYYKGILYIGSGIIVFAFSLYLRTKGFTAAISYTDRHRSGKRTDYATISQLFSEVIVLSGAGILIVVAVLAVLADRGAEQLKHAGPLLIMADSRDERTYRVAFDAAIAAMRRDQSERESGFAGFGGEGSTRSG